MQPEGRLSYGSYRFMGKRQRLVEDWLLNTPRHAPVGTVLGVVKYYFPGQEKMPKGKGGSHYVVKDIKLTQYQHLGFDPLGIFVIPVKGGKRVKGRYLQTLAKAIVLLNSEEYPNIDTSIL